MCVCGVCVCVCVCVVCVCACVCGVCACVCACVKHFDMRCKGLSCTYCNLLRVTAIMYGVHVPKQPLTVCSLLLAPRAKSGPETWNEVPPRCVPWDGLPPLPGAPYTAHGCQLSPHLCEPTPSTHHSFCLEASLVCVFSRLMRT